MAIDLKLHARQSDCFLSEATEILYGGAAGGGKSHAMRAIAIIYALQIPNLQIYLFRRLSDDLKKNHLDGESGFRNTLREYINAGSIKINETTNQIIFPNGAKIHLCHCQYEKDVYKYQGVEINILLIDELTHFSEFIYKFLRSRVRLGGLKVPEKFKGKFPMILTSSNPGGVGHSFVKKMFIDNCEPFQIREMSPDDGGMLRQFIPAKLADNPTMTENDPLYSQKLLGLGGSLAKAMLEGDWNAIEGAYFDKFSHEKHVISPFSIPKHWYRIRALDWGYSKPFCALWGAVSPGETFLGQYIPKDAIVIYREWYGCVPDKENVGLRLENTEIANGILQREEGDYLNDMVADPAIFAQNGGESIAEQMQNGGVYFRPADNQRIAGWQQVRYRLAGDEEERPLLYIFSTCKHLLRTLPVMQHDQTRVEDLDSDMEDHAVDTLRYLCMSRPLTLIKQSENLRKDGKIYGADLIAEIKLESGQKSYQ